MSSFTDSNFVKKLSELNNTQQSIQTLSLWLIHHRKHSKTITQVWLRELQKVRPSMRLIYMYLANDVIQNSKKKGPEFTRDFATVMTDAFASATKDAEEKTKKSVDRILNIWQERGVYSKNTIDKIKSGTGNQIIHKSAISDIAAEINLKRGRDKKKVEEYVPVNKVKDHQPVDAAPPNKKKKKEEMLSLREEIELMSKDDTSGPPDAEELVKRLSDLEHSASSDAAVREKIAALPPEVSDVNHLAKIHDKESGVKLSRKVEDACILLSEYNFRLNAELEERKMVGKMLKDFIACQKEQLMSAEKKIEEYKKRLDKVTEVRVELESHIKNLPDFDLLPRLTGGLAPLPSAGDLFNMQDGRR
ncbi:regulation of nuclear pre-mRNA domain-containing protein 1B-like isoform X3 [Mytilus californianus]|uniref:regulation of nuclear pre-mRNA domain-containing protein 1B-like isoform X3 n=1 Tax=Mytilus californianus TaxID=6549 RepID=UPI002247EBE6|nr:regulation of nuclear pre-mRNA domain-containing protein 1B-like isoform X3 [Mytilus californianus]